MYLTVSMLSRSSTLHEMLCVSALNRLLLFWQPNQKRSAQQLDGLGRLQHRVLQQIRGCQLTSIMARQGRRRQRSRSKLLYDQKQLCGCQRARKPKARKQNKAQHEQVSCLGFQTCTLWHIMGLIAGQHSRVRCSDSHHWRQNSCTLVLLFNCIPDVQKINT